MKTKIESNYHTHTFLCKHAIGDVEDYVKRAIQLGYHTIAQKNCKKSLLLEE